jgi:hypothetical protein
LFKYFFIPEKSKCHRHFAFLYLYKVSTSFHPFLRAWIRIFNGNQLNFFRQGVGAKPSIFFREPAVEATFPFKRGLGGEALFSFILSVASAEALKSLPGAWGRSPFSFILSVASAEALKSLPGAWGRSPFSFLSYRWLPPKLSNPFRGLGGGAPIILIGWVGG